MFRHRIAAAAALAALVLAASAAGKTVEERPQLAANWMDAKVPEGFTVTAAGDLIITHPLAKALERTDPDLLKLLRSGDVTFGNFEGTSIDLSTFDGYPAALSGGSWELFSPKVPGDLRDMGFDVVSRANNHATDWGIKGLLATDRLLDEAGIVRAGSGRSMSEARAPAMLTTAAGRVAVVAMASRFEADSIAADPLGQIPARPGINGLRTTRFALVSPERFAQLAAIRDAQPPGSVRAGVLAGDKSSGTVTLFGARYRASAAVGEGMSFSFSMNEGDLAANLRSIRQAKQSSDFSIATIHVHEPGNYSDVPPDFLPALAHRAIDQGADMFIGHGPHQLRGIEIYKGKPIFYSLGNLFFMFNQMQPLTRDEYDSGHSSIGDQTEAEYLEVERVDGVFRDSVWYESVIAKSKFDARGRVTEVKLYPVELHWAGGRDADRGIPRLAPPEVGRRTLERLQRLSAPYSTRIAIEGGVGVIRVGSVSANAPSVGRAR